MDSRVWQKFDAVANRYDQASTLQQQSAQHLLQLMHTVEPESVWLDAGCGTGILAKALANQGARVWAIDLAPNMLQHLEDDDRIQTIQADMRELPLPDEMLDGVVSNFALHWLGSRCIDELLRVIQPGGDAWLAVPVQGSLNEVITRYHHFPVFNFEPMEHWLACAGNHVAFSDIQTFRQSYPNLKSLLAALRQMGGNQTGHAASRPDFSLWRQWLQDDTPIDLSFDVLFMHLKKPADQHALAFLYD